MSKVYVEVVDGANQVAGTRVSLDSIVYGFISGQSAEGIAQSFSVLTLEQGLRRHHVLPGESRSGGPLPGGATAGLRGEAGRGTRSRPDVLPEARGREEAEAAHLTQSPKAAALLREALSLPERKRLDLAAALIESVDKERAREDVQTAWSSEAKRRLAEGRSGAVKPVAWERAERLIFDGA